MAAKEQADATIMQQRKLFKEREEAAERKR